MVEKDRIENPCFHEFPALSERFLFTSPHNSLITEGCFRRLHRPLAGHQAGNGFPEEIAAALQQAREAGIKHPIVVGAIPFDTQQPAELFIPQRYHCFDQAQLTEKATKKKDVPMPPVASSRLIPAQEDFMSMVSQAVDAMKRGEADKVVLSRLREIDCADDVDTDTLMAQLVRQNPQNYHFHVPLSDGGTLVGASPELLIRKQGAAFASCPLAGSAGRHPSPSQDTAIGQQLLRSEKDRREHQLVIDAMRRTLQPVSETLSVPETPELVTTASLWHLATAIEGTLKQPSLTALSLALLLHPTPALSGFPHQQAVELIRTLEPFNRGLFGGIVGWCDDQGNGEWVVTIRCATLNQRRLTLFAGAGIIPASDPFSEWQETGIKLSTLLRALGCDQEITQ